jgi:hypothetical protein
MIPVIVHVHWLSNHVFTSALNARTHLRKYTMNKSIFLLADRAGSVSMYVCMYIRLLLQNYTKLRLHFRGRGAFVTRDCTCSLA